MHDSGDATLSRRVEAAINAHDLDALTSCFAADYRLEMPCHPARDFVGRAQVRRNWTQLFGAFPDLRETMVRTCAVGDQVWAEWEMTGTRSDGRPMVMRGMSVWGERDGEIAWCRFYLEPVEVDDVDADAAVRDVVGGSR